MDLLKSLQALVFAVFVVSGAPAGAATFGFAFNGFVDDTFGSYALGTPVSGVVWIDRSVDPNFDISSTGQTWRTAFIDQDELGSFSAIFRVGSDGFAIDGSLFGALVSLGYPDRVRSLVTITDGMSSQSFVELAFDATVPLDNEPATTDIDATLQLFLLAAIGSGGHSFRVSENLRDTADLRFTVTDATVVPLPLPATLLLAGLIFLRLGKRPHTLR